MLKIKDNTDLKELEKFGFIRRNLGIYGPRDLLPEYWYEKRYHYKHKEFYITTNHRFYFSDKSTLTSLKLYKDNGAKKDKLIPFNRIYKIVRIIIKDLIQVGIVEKVKK